ncbi:hypothetical protein PFLUV_G00227260 [Perca fluviatilis]|uniref:Uncharacterized protein n=1 Tax=Perca fluviatilis TaxID=8168 RepID=A0A6A5ECR8_PERFL|nr:hypothetical protein PFLUV_G00227260 [Perca fluviatilis]
MSWIVLDNKLIETPTWGECYATHDTGGRSPGDTWTTTFKSEVDDSEEKDPVEPKDDGCLSVPSPPNSSFPSPATSWSPPHNASWTRSVTQNQWRAIEAAASHPYKTRGHRGFRAPVFMHHRCGCCCCNCSHRRYRPWRYRPWRYRPWRYRAWRFRAWRRRPTRCTPRVTSWEHLPVTIQPTKWYQVVGRMQCSQCYAQGWHCMTSWMCQTCQVPLCLLPYRNCYAEWHGQKC